jgi:predicted nucleic acid-binding Zn ribbon protein
VRRAEPIGKVLRDVINDLGLAKKMSEQRAVTEWPEIVGPRVAEHARALRVSGGRLFVEVDSSVWSQELSLMKRRILREVNRRVGRQAIEHVHFVLGGSTSHDSTISHCGKDEEDGEE